MWMTDIGKTILLECFLDLFLLAISVVIFPFLSLLVTEQSSGDSGANVKRLEVETAEKINHLSTEGSRISGDVVKMLLKQVTTVKN